MIHFTLTSQPNYKLNTLKYLWYYHKKFWRLVNTTWISRGSGINTHFDWAVFSNHNTYLQLNKLTLQIFMPHSYYGYAMLVLHVYFTVDLYWCFTIFDPGSLRWLWLSSIGADWGSDLAFPGSYAPPTPPRSLENQCHNHHIFTCFSIASHWFCITCFLFCFFSSFSLAW